METFKFIVLFVCIGVATTVDMFVRVRFRGSALMTSYSNQETITAKNEQELREKLTETFERALLDKQIEEVIIETDIYHGNEVHSTQVTKFDVTTADGLDGTTRVTTTKSDDITKAVTSSAARSSNSTRKVDDVTTSKVIENVFTTRSITSVASTHQESTMTATSDVSSTFAPTGVKYDGKLFIPLLFKNDERMNIAEAESRCQKIGGELANIYNNDHMDRIMGFIRSSITENYIHFNFHLGMTYDPKEHKVILRNQTGVPENQYKWRNNFPHANMNKLLLYLRVDKNETSTEQYLWNEQDLNKHVLCEVPHNKTTPQPN
ncbi:uncharacterized protein LOC120346984 [Styela clava]